MSGDKVVAKRYAKALFQVAKEQSIIDQVEQQLQAISTLIADLHDFRKWLQHPNISVPEKIDVLREVFQQKVSEPVYRTIHLMIERGRGTLISALANYYTEAANEALGRASATVYTPLKLSNKEVGEITDQFGRLTGKSIKLDQVVDASLLGGMQVRIGDRLYDGSVSGKLARLEKALYTSQAL